MHFVTVGDRREQQHARQGPSRDKASWQVRQKGPVATGFQAFLSRQMLRFSVAIEIFLLRQSLLGSWDFCVSRQRYWVLGDFWVATWSFMSR